MDLEILGCGEREKEADGVGLGDGSERLGKINAGFLCETLRNESGLVLRDLARHRAFDTENPLAANRLLVSRSGNQLKGTDGHNCVHFGLHCCSPFVLVDRANRFLI